MCMGAMCVNKVDPVSQIVRPLVCPSHTHILPWCRFFAFKSDLAATANSLQLVKALKNRMWDGTVQQCRWGM